MKAVPLAFRGVLLGLVTTSLHAQGPILSTPGTATWTEETTAGGGTRTIFTITDNTVLDWNQLNLVGSGNELVFDFVGGDTIVNNLNGSYHKIDGSVTSNGFVGFFAPNGSLVVNGSVTAKGVTIATLGVSPTEFASGNYSLSGGSGGRLLINGHIDATQGDVVLASKSLNIAGNAAVTATGSAFFAGGTDATVSASGDRRLNVIGTIGNITHSGVTVASRLEVAAGNTVTNVGRLDSGTDPVTSKIFIEVGEDGRISNELNGIIVGDSVFDGAFLDNGVLIRPGTDLGDVPPVIGESRSKVPPLKRSNGTTITTKKKVSYSTPMSASSDAGRVAKRKDRQVAKVDSSKSLLRRSSFFGVRGSKTIASR